MISPINTQQSSSCRELSSEDKIKARNSLITAIAKVSLKELAVSLLFTGIAICFAATAFTIAMLVVAAVAMVIFNALLRGMSAHAQYKALLLKHLPEDDLNREEAEKKAATLEKMTDYFCPITFSLVDSDTRDLVTHEGGHALAALALYKNPRPIISLEAKQPFSVGGVTSIYPQKLSSLGKKIGAKNASTIMGAAGAALSLVFSTVNIVIAHKLKKSHPRLSLYFLSAAITSIARHVIYALSALWTARKDLAHDFIRIWAGGVHPIISAITIIALPLIVKGSMLLYDYLRTPAKKPENLGTRVAAFT